MPLYGSVLWDVSSNDILKFYSTRRKGLRRLFNLPYKTHSRYLPLLCNDLPVTFQLISRINKFKCFQVRMHALKWQINLRWMVASPVKVCYMYPNYCSVTQTVFDHLHFNLES